MEIVTKEYVEIIQAFGAIAIVQDILKDEIIQLSETSFFQSSDGGTIADRLVSLIRKANQHPRYGDYVGQSCLSIVMYSNLLLNVESRYHPQGQRAGTYTPIILDPALRQPISFQAGTPSDIFEGNFLRFGISGRGGTMEEIQALVEALYRKHMQSENAG